MVRGMLFVLGAASFSAALAQEAPDQDALMLLQVRAGRVQRHLGALDAIADVLASAARHYFDNNVSETEAALTTSSDVTVHAADLQSNVSDGPAVSGLLNSSQVAGVHSNVSSGLNSSVAASSMEVSVDIAEVKANVSATSNSPAAENSTGAAVDVAEVQANVSAQSLAANVSEGIVGRESGSNVTMPVWTVSPDEATLYWQKALLESDFQDPPLDANASDTHFIEVAAPSRANVSEANATTHANKSADLLELGVVEVHQPATGAKAELSEAGYHAVATLKNVTEMEAFILRVADSLDITVSKSGWRALRGFVPFYSGDKAVRSVRAMKEEMHRIAAIPRAWLSKRGGSAPLNEVGFDAVASLKNRTEMERFVRRMAGDYLDMTVMSEKGLEEFVPDYCGEKSKKGFDVLLDELRQVAKSKSAWLIDRHEDLMHSGEECLSHCKEAGFCSWCGIGNACCKNGGDNPEECRAAVTDFHTTDFECLQIVTGASAPLDQRGYAAVVELKNNTMMTRFVRRVAEHLDMTIKSEMSLAGIIPWYSGVQGKKSFTGLKAELTRVANLPNGWLAPRGKTAPLNDQGYNVVAALGSNLEMAEFARRVAANQNLQVKDEKGLRGLAPYYSGDRTRHDFATLAAELKHLSEKPDNWIVPGPAASTPPAAPAA